MQGNLLKRSAEAGTEMPASAQLLHERGDGSMEAASLPGKAIQVGGEAGQDLVGRHGDPHSPSLSGRCQWPSGQSPDGP